MSHQESNLGELVPRDYGHEVSEGVFGLLTPSDIIQAEPRSLTDFGFSALRALRIFGVVPTPRYNLFPPWVKRISHTPYAKCNPRITQMKLCLHLDGYLNSVDQSILDFSLFGDSTSNKASLMLLRISIRELIGVNPPRFRFKTPKPETVQEKVLAANLELNAVLSHHPEHEGPGFCPKIKDIDIFSILNIEDPPVEEKRIVNLYDSNLVRKRMGYRPKGESCSRGLYESIRGRVYRSQYVRDFILYGVITKLLEWRKYNYEIYLKGYEDHSPFEFKLALERHLRCLANLGYYTRVIDGYIDSGQIDLNDCNFIATDGPGSLPPSPSFEEIERDTPIPGGPSKLNCEDFLSNKLESKPGTLGRIWKNSRIHRLLDQGPMNPDLPCVRNVEDISTNGDFIQYILDINRLHYNRVTPERRRQLEGLGSPVLREVSREILEIIDTRQDHYIRELGLRKYLHEIAVLLRSGKSWAEAESYQLSAVADSMVSIDPIERAKVLRVYLKEAQLRCAAMNDPLVPPSSKAWKGAFSDPSKRAKPFLKAFVPR